MSNLKSLRDVLDDGCGSLKDKYYEEVKKAAKDWIEEIEKEVEVDSSKVFKCSVNEDGDFEYWYEGKVEDQIQETSIALIAWIKLFFNLED